MESVSYKSLSPNERREAQELAQTLMREVPDTVEPPRFIRPTFAASVPYMRPHKLVAAFVYPVVLGREEAWSGDVVFQDGPQLKQIGCYGSLDSRTSSAEDIVLLHRTAAMPHLSRRSFHYPG
jgi:hypothetical protein